VSRRARTFANAAFVVAGLAATLGCQRVERRAESTAPAAERLATTAHYTLRVLGVETCRTSGARAPSDTSRRIGVNLSLEPTTDVQVPANAYYARLLDEQRQVHEATLSLPVKRNEGSCGEPLAPALPQRGHPARGYVVFDVPRNSRQLTLLYAPELVDLPKEEVSIALGP